MHDPADDPRGSAELVLLGPSSDLTAAEIAERLAAFIESLAGDERSTS